MKYGVCCRLNIYKKVALRGSEHSPRHSSLVADGRSQIVVEYESFLLIRVSLLLIMMSLFAYKYESFCL